MKLLTLVLMLSGLSFGAKDLKGHLGDEEFNDLSDIVKARYFRVISYQAYFSFSDCVGQIFWCFCPYYLSINTNSTLCLFSLPIR